LAAAIRLLARGFRDEPLQVASLGPDPESSDLVHGATKLSITPGQGPSAGALEVEGVRRPPGSSPLPPRSSPETGLERRRRRLSSESGVKLVVREVRYKSRWEIRL
jgi:hypothetical protein